MVFLGELAAEELQSICYLERHAGGWDGKARKIKLITASVSVSYASITASSVILSVP